MGLLRNFDENMLFSKAIRERLDHEASLTTELGTERAYWYAVRNHDNGQRTVERNYDPSQELDLISTLDPPGYQQSYAMHIGDLLNRECGHDGAWVVAFTHPPTFGNIIGVDPNYEWRRMVKLWMDREGDVAFAIDCVNPFWMVAQESEDHFIEQAEQAWKKWKLLMRDVLDPKCHQLKPLAQLKERGLA